MRVDVLVVEANADDAAAILGALQAHRELSVQLATSLREAVALLRENRYHLVVLDHQLPDLPPGRTASEVVVPLARPGRVIVYSLDTATATVLTAYADGADAVQGKGGAVVLLEDAVLGNALRVLEERAELAEVAQVERGGGMAALWRGLSPVEQRGAAGVVALLLLSLLLVVLTLVGVDVAPLVELVRRVFG